MCMRTKIQWAIRIAEELGNNFAWPNTSRLLNVNMLSARRFINWQSLSWITDRKTCVCAHMCSSSSFLSISVQMLNKHTVFNYSALSKTTNIATVMLLHLRKMLTLFSLHHFNELRVTVDSSTNRLFEARLYLKSLCMQAPPQQASLRLLRIRLRGQPLLVHLLL